MNLTIETVITNIEPIQQKKTLSKKNSIKDIKIKIDQNIHFPKL